MNSDPTLRCTVLFVRSSLCLLHSPYYVHVFLGGILLSLFAAHSIIPNLELRVTTTRHGVSTAFTRTPLSDMSKGRSRKLPQTLRHALHSMFMAVEGLDPCLYPAINIIEIAWGCARLHRRRRRAICSLDSHRFWLRVFQNPRRFPHI